MNDEKWEDAMLKIKENFLQMEGPAPAGPGFSQYGPDGAGPSKAQKTFYVSAVLYKKFASISPLPSRYSSFQCPSFKSSATALPTSLE